MGLAVPFYAGEVGEGRLGLVLGLEVGWVGGWFGSGREGGAFEEVVLVGD